MVNGIFSAILSLFDWNLQFLPPPSCFLEKFGFIFHINTEVLFYLPHRNLTNFLAIDTAFLNFNVTLFHKAWNFLTFFRNYSVVNTPRIVLTYVLPEMYIAVALPSFIHRFPITQHSELRIYNDIQEQTSILRNATKHLYIPVVETLMTNNRQTWPSVLSDLRGTYKSRDFSVTYLIDFI
jgi:hypothetical protein